MGSRVCAAKAGIITLAIGLGPARGLRAYQLSASTTVHFNQVAQAYQVQVIAGDLSTWDGGGAIGNGGEEFCTS